MLTLSFSVQSIVATSSGTVIFPEIYHSSVIIYLISMCIPASFTRELIVIGIDWCINTARGKRWDEKAGCKLKHCFTASDLAAGTSAYMVGRYNPQHTANKDEPTSYIAIE